MQRGARALVVRAQQAGNAAAAPDEEKEEKQQGHQVPKNSAANLEAQDPEILAYREHQVRGRCRRLHSGTPACAAEPRRKPPPLVAQRGWQQQGMVRLPNTPRLAHPECVIPIPGYCGAHHAR